MTAIGLYMAVSYTHLDVYKRQSYGTVCVRVRADSHQALCVMGTWSDSTVYARSDFIYM